MTRAPPQSPGQAEEESVPSDSRKTMGAAGAAPGAFVNDGELLRTVIDLIPAFIYAKDLQSRFIVCNRFAASAMGTTAEQAIGRTDRDFYPQEMAVKFHEDEQRVLSSESPVIDREESALDRGTGRLRVLLTSKVPLRDANGTIVGVVGTGRDITELKEAERRLAAAGRLQSIGRLAAGIAHEINTPVQFIGDSVYYVRDALSELLSYVNSVHTMRPGVPPRSADLLEFERELPVVMNRIVGGLERITEIVRSMKEFSYPEQSQMRGADLNRLVQTTLVVARNEYRYVADVNTHFGELPLVTCFGGHINQVILNLIVNAAHAIADKEKEAGGRGLIGIRTFVEDCHAVVAVSDTGTGISEEIREHVFDPFFTTKEVGRGTGQGLSICRNIVVGVHAGSLTFETEPGSGTTFYVRLPLKRDSAADPGDTTAKR